MINRRELLEWIVASGGLAALGRLPADQLEAIGRGVHGDVQRELRGDENDPVQQPRLRSLDAATAAVVTAAAERIIPRTDTPGATDVHVTAFIDVMLSDWYADSDRARFLTGIHSLDADAQSRHARGFAACTEREQVDMLSAAESVVTTLRRTDATAANNSWFAMLKYLTVYGYCTSEPGMREHLGSWPPPMTYDPAAPVRAR